MVSTIFIPSGSLYIAMIIGVLLIIIRCRTVENFIIVPAVTTPFGFLLRAQDPGNVALVAFAEVILIVVTLIVGLRRVRLSHRIHRYSLYLALLAILIVVISVIHWSDSGFSVYFAADIIRFYVAPAIFLLVISGLASENRLLVRKFVVVYSTSLSVVSLVLLTNYLVGQPFIPSHIRNFEPFFPEDARSFSGLSIDRMNLMMGGANGSIAGIFVCAGLLLAAVRRAPYSLWLSIMALACFAAGFMTISFTPILVLCFYTIIRVASAASFHEFFSFAFLLIALLLSFAILDISEGVNLFGYFKWQLVQMWHNLLTIPVENYLFGVGPYNRYSVGPLGGAGELSIDLGFIRFILDYGILPATLLLIVVIKSFKVFLKNECLRSSKFASASLTCIFASFFGIHGFVAFLPTVYPLFACCLLLLVYYRRAHSDELTYFGRINSIK